MKQAAFQAREARAVEPRLARSSDVVVLGGGMAGLATALALKDSGLTVLILERDPQAQLDAPEHAFDNWDRKGVPQLQHTHIFLSRARKILRDHHPELLAELERAGMCKATMSEILPPALVGVYVEREVDDDLLHLWGRRATFEYVLRRHVERLPHVQFAFGAKVERLQVQSRGSQLQVSGVEIKRGGRSELVTADYVIDALGQQSKCVDELREHGARIDTLLERSACAYYCRHYRAAGDTSPVRGGTATNIDYLIAGLFFAEQNTFSIAFTCADDDEALKETLKNPAGFDGVCESIPSLAAWTRGAERLTRVLGGASLKNRWHSFETHPRRHVLGFFALGDSHIQTNPIYGRGCSMAFVQAHALAAALAPEVDPLARARHYYSRVRRELKGHFEFCVSGDRTFIARVKRSRGVPLSATERWLLLGYDTLPPTVGSDPAVAREWLKLQQMLEPSPPWVTLSTLLRIGSGVIKQRVLRRARQAFDLKLAAQRRTAVCG